MPYEDPEQFRTTHSPACRTGEAVKTFKSGLVDIQTIYQGAERFLNEILAQEALAQGHHLSGTLAESLSSKTVKTGKEDVMQGFAVYYAQYVDQGIPPKSATFKQVPFLIDYFISRGYSKAEATSFAFATVKTWMKEGMSTQASKRFSQTGARQNFIESAFVGNNSKIDDYMEDSFDFQVEEEFQKEKSGVV